MNIIIVFESKYGNGKELCEALDDILRSQGHQSQLFSVRDVETESLSYYDMYVFSTPTHMGGPARRMKNFLKKAVFNKNVRYALITTHQGDGTKAIVKMEALLKEKGLPGLTTELKVKVDGMKGPLEKDYRQHLVRFADALSQ